VDTISEFLRGKQLLVTGATGFLGQPLVEKILWAAPDVERINVLIRPKRKFGGRVQTPAERLRRELFQSSVFDRLRYRHGEQLERFLAQKLHAVAGDISEDGLGIDPNVRAQLERELDVVINSAAVVSFDAPLDDALDLNTLGAGRVTDFTASCERAVLIHVSTAYVCGATDEPVSETFHHAAESDEPFPPRQFTDPERDIARIREIITAVREQGQGADVRRELVQALVQRRRGRGAGRAEPRREMIQNLRSRWIQNRLTEEGMKWARQRGWNDTYTYTKALGEQVVLRQRGDLPVAVVRPAIIESSLAEPSPGWLDGLRMADPLIAAIGKGRLRSLPLNPKVTLDLVPADMVVNTILAAMPKLVQERGIAIYQVATGSRNPVTMGRLHDLIVRYFTANPMLDRNDQPIRVKPLTFPEPEQFRLMYRAKAEPLKRFERILRRLVAWGVLNKQSQKYRRRLAARLAAMETLYYYGELYEPYLNLDCQFKVDNTMRLLEGLTEEERNLYNFDVTRINWPHYMHVHIAGVKKHILKVERAGTLELDDEAATQRASVSTINDLLRQSAEKFPDRTALQMKRDDEWVQITFAELKERSEEIGERFRRLGFHKGDRVVLYSENQPEWGVAYMGAASIGLVVVPLDAQTWHREVWSTARFVGAQAMLASESGFERLAPEGLEENERSDSPILVLNVDRNCQPFDLDSYPRSTRPAEKEPPALTKADRVRPDDPASIIFTTGTAVDPRGAIHTHRNFLNNLFGVSRTLSVSQHDRLLSVLPLYHALEFPCGFLTPIYHGGTISYAQSLKPKVILEAMRETGTTIMLGVPTLYALIRDDLERRVLRAGKSPLRLNLMETTKQISRSWERTFNRNIGRQIFSRVHQELGGSVRFFVSGGSALGAELYEDYRAMGLTIYEGYGLTETAPVLTVNPLYQSRPASCGKPLPGVELRLYHTDNEGVGEIMVQSPSLMNGYYNNTEATERVMVDGWFHTGDLGWVDADGYLYITGRKKDVIVTGAGKNVYPMDLEAIYRALPSVREICVVGIPSGLTEEVHAIVEPDPALLVDASADEVQKLIQREVQAQGRELPSYHRLQQVHLWAGLLPRTNDGQIDRTRLRGWIERTTRARADREAPTVATGPGRVELKAQLHDELARLSGRPLEEISPTTHLYEDLGLDSLRAIELFLFVEHAIGETLDDEAAAEVETVEQLLAIVAPEKRAPKKLIAAQPEPALRSTLPYPERKAVDRWLLGSAGRGLEALYTSYFDLELVHTERLPRKRPYLLAANHSSHLDAPAVLSAVRLAHGPEAARSIHVLGARDYFFDTTLKGWFFSTFLNVVPIEREETSLAGLRTVKSILTSGESALIFPEGTRSRSGEIQPFKPGLGLIAWELRTPIVPVYISGTHDALPVGRNLPRRQRLRIEFGHPITMDAYEKAEHRIPTNRLYREIAADVRNTIMSMSDGQQEPDSGNGAGGRAE
jgi:long-chain acyl-CoA synthetase